MPDAKPPQPNRLTIGQDDVGRLDRVVADWLGLSRAAVLRLLDSGGLALNSRVLERKDKGRMLVVDDALTVEGSLAEGEAPRPDPDLHVQVLAQGSGWIAINKAAGVPVRPHALNELGTALNAVVRLKPETVGVGEGGLRSGVVHRLDTDTSGAMLFATAQDAWQRLRLAFAEHRIIKRYEAIVKGCPPVDGRSELDLYVARHAPSRVAIAGEAGGHTRRCGLSWRVLEQFGQEAALIEVGLETGFLHQVRVMMSHLGYPVLGDKAYGNATTTKAAPRQMLHARSLVFEEISVDAPRPEDFEAVADRLKGSA